MSRVWVDPQPAIDWRHVWNTLAIFSILAPVAVVAVIALEPSPTRETHLPPAVYQVNESQP